jgi:hypothetical protein
MVKQKPSTVTTDDVSALTPAPTPVPAPVTVSAPAVAAQPKPFLSEGMRHDLEDNGWAVDPSSGARFELNRETGEVTVTEKGTTNPETGEAVEGKVTEVDVEVTPPATRIDPETGETLVTDPATGVTTATDPETGETRTVEPTD